MSFAAAVYVAASAAVEVTRWLSPRSKLVPVKPLQAAPSSVNPVPAAGVPPPALSMQKDDASAGCEVSAGVLPVVTALGLVVGVACCAEAWMPVM